MWTVLDQQIHVIVGPLDAAAAYARKRGWKVDEFRIVTDAEELHQLDPPSILGIFVVQARQLGRDVYLAIKDEIDLLKRLWPVPVQAVAR